MSAQPKRLGCAGAAPGSHAAQQLESALADAKRLAHTARPCWQTQACSCPEKGIQSSS